MNHSSLIANLESIRAQLDVEAHLVQALIDAMRFMLDAIARLKTDIDQLSLQALIDAMSFMFDAIARLKTDIDQLSHEVGALSREEALQVDVIGLKDYVKAPRQGEPEA